MHLSAARKTSHVGRLCVLRPMPLSTCHEGGGRRAAIYADKMMVTLRAGRRSEREIIVEGTKIRACGREILTNEALSVLLHARLSV